MIKQKKEKKERVANVVHLKLLSEVMNAYLSKKKVMSARVSECVSVHRLEFFREL